MKKGILASIGTLLAGAGLAFAAGPPSPEPEAPSPVWPQGIGLGKVPAASTGGESVSPGRVTVRLPADALLYVDAVFCPLTTGTRSFDTPPLPAGRPFFYTLRVELVRGGQTFFASKRVEVEAGLEAEVDFGNLIPAWGDPVIAPAANPAAPIVADHSQRADCSRFWASGEYLLWWAKKGPESVPVATEGGTGVITSPGTFVVLGGSGVDYKVFSGLRLSAGYWFDPDQTFGIEASGFFLPQQTVTSSVSSNGTGNPAIFRPVTDVNFGEGFFNVSNPGNVAGTISTSSKSSLWGCEINGVANMSQDGKLRLDLLGGFRYLDLDERFEITTFQNDLTGFLNDPSNPGNLEPAGSTLTVLDRFHTQNQFYGGQIGGRMEYRFANGLYVDLRGQVALGDTHETVTVSGLTEQTKPGAVSPTTFVGGVLAAGNRLGTFQHDEFSVVPEGEARIGYQFNNRFRAFAGYDFLFWSNVARPGDQVSRTVDVTTIPTAGLFDPTAHGATAPVPIKSSGYWAQGLNFGMEFDF